MIFSKAYVKKNCMTTGQRDDEALCCTWEKLIRESALVSLPPDNPTMNKIYWKCGRYEDEEDHSGDHVCSEIR